MQHGEDATAARIVRKAVPVTILLSCRLLRRGFWSVPQWRLDGVLVGEHLTHRPSAGRPLRPGAGVAADGPVSGRTYAFDGYRVTLHRDAAERYWHALIGEQPRVYVVCRELPDPAAGVADEQPPARPLRVTLDYDEALAFAETDQLVLSAPIPGELYRLMEEFVLIHYKPKPFVKRKRRRWDADAVPGTDKRARR